MGACNRRGVGGLACVAGKDAEAYSRCALRDPTVSESHVGSLFNSPWYARADGSDEPHKIGRNVSGFHLLDGKSVFEGHLPCRPLVDIDGSAPRHSNQLERSMGSVHRQQLRARSVLRRPKNLDRNQARRKAESTECTVEKEGERFLRVGEKSAGHGRRTSDCVGKPASV